MPKSITNDADERRRKAANAQTLHILSTSPKRCLTCGDVRAADVYKCPVCRTIKTGKL